MAHNIFNVGDTAYRVEWISAQHIPDGEEYNPDIHDTWKSVIIMDKTHAFAVCDLKIKNTCLHYSRVYECVFCDSDGYTHWKDLDCIYTI